MQFWAIFSVPEFIPNFMFYLCDIITEYGLYSFDITPAKVTDYNFWIFPNKAHAEYMYSNLE